MARLFVYGTLRYGGSANFYLQDCRLISLERRASHYQMYNLGRYPAVVEAADTALAVTGDIYEVGRQTLKRIDKFEGPAYCRKFDDNLQAFIYVAKENISEKYALVRSGDWLAYARDNKIRGFS